ncbi:MAG TPA: erythromycin esterase family protein [Kofleriaceae bacterium]
MVTDLSSGQELSGQWMDSAGQLTSVLPPGHYTFAATTNTGFAFFEKELTSSDHLLIALSSDCERLHGRVTGTIAFPAVVMMSRISNARGDKFIIPIDRDGGFAACLPQAGYAARVDGAMVSLQVPVVVPRDATIAITVYSAAQVRETPTDIRVGHSDLPSFARSLRDHRIVGLGEANHGTAEFCSYRAKLSLELARVGTLRTILLEADAIGMMAIDDYVMGADVDIAKAVVALRFWVTDIQEFLAFLADIRTYNASRPPADKIRVLGVDAQRVDPPVQLLQAHRAELAISEHESELLSQIVPDHGAAFPKLSSDDRAALSSLLDRLANPRGQANLEGVATRASVAAHSIRCQLGYLGSTEELRDRAMAELTAYIVELSGTGQAALWAHDGHIARQSDYATKSLGQYLSETFKEAYFPIAFLSYQGQARAWDKPGKIGVIPHDLAPAPSHNVESVIMQATRFPDAAWVRVDLTSGPLAHWLSLPRYVREFGAFYDPGDTQILWMFPAAFAAVVVIQHGHPSTPTPTGVRKITP